MVIRLRRLNKKQKEKRKMKKFLVLLTVLFFAMPFTMSVSPASAQTYGYRPSGRVPVPSYNYYPSYGYNGYVSRPVTVVYQAVCRPSYYAVPSYNYYPSRGYRSSYYSSGYYPYRYVSYYPSYRYSGYSSFSFGFSSRGYYYNPYRNHGGHHRHHRRHH